MATHSSVLAWRIPAWWAAVYGVAQSQTRLKRLRSSSSSLPLICGHSSTYFQTLFLKHLKKKVLLAALSPGHCVRDSHCRGDGLWGLCAQQLRCMGLNRSVGCAIFLDQGANSCLLHCQVDSQPLDHQGSLILAFKN